MRRAWRSARLVLVVGLTAVSLAPGHAALAAPTRATPPDSITVAFRPTTSPAQLPGVDPSALPVTVTATATDCSTGCELHRFGSLRFNEDDVLIGRVSFPAQATPRAFAFPDTTYTTGPAELSWEYQLWHLAPDGSYDISADVPGSPEVLPDTAVSVDAGWHRDAAPAATETMILRSTSAGATASWPVSSSSRHVGIISATGPANGVMQVVLAGRVVRTLDLTGGTFQPRRVVAALDVPAGARLQVRNATPSGRRQADVHVDGLVTLDASFTSTVAPTGRGPASTARSPLAVTQESLSVLPVVGQQVPGYGRLTVKVAAVAKVYGCPSGCRILWHHTNAAGSPVETVLLSTTSPASSTLQTLRATTTLSQDSDDSFSLEKGGTGVASSAGFQPFLADDPSWTYSDGWGTETGDLVSFDAHWSGSPGMGATYRVYGTFDGRPVGVVAARGPDRGVAGIYANGVLVQTVDLYAAVPAPRQVVASLQLPLRGRLTVVNRTPAGRTGTAVQVDGLVVLDEPEDFY